MIHSGIGLLMAAGFAFAQDAIPMAEQLDNPDPVPAATIPPPTPNVPICPKKAPPKPYKTLFYDNDFSYLDAPGNTYFYFGDSFKELHPLPRTTLSVGGEYRMRQQNEHILGRNSDFLLQRTRLFMDYKVNGWLRAYVEGIDAVSSFEDITPRPIEENRFDALNMFGDIRLRSGHHGALWFRGGRQELLYGAQRLVSPLDWSNTRRTFDGFKAFWRGSDWNVDAWWTRPVPFGQHLAGGVTDRNFDHPDQSREFSGIWATRKVRKDRRWDFFYLRYIEYDPAVRTFQYNTFGSRYEGNSGRWLWEFEGGYQFGRVGAGPQSAGFYTIGFGRKLDLPWKPVLWVYYDWASGTRNPFSGTNQTFNQLFPLGHKYFGFMDVVGRQNIEDWNCRVVASPHKKVKLLIWFHVFHLQQARDALYNAAGAIVTQNPIGTSGQNVGQELDFTITILLKPRLDLLFGYSHLYSGRFLLDQMGVAQSDFYYGQCRLRF